MYLKLQPNKLTSLSMSSWKIPWSLAMELQSLRMPLLLGRCPKLDSLRQKGLRILFLSAGEDSKKPLVLHKARLAIALGWINPPRLSLGSLSEESLKE